MAFSTLLLAFIRGQCLNEEVWYTDSLVCGNTSKVFGEQPILLMLNSYHGNHKSQKNLSQTCVWLGFSQAWINKYAQHRLRSLGFNGNLGEIPLYLICSRSVERKTCNGTGKTPNTYQVCVSASVYSTLGMGCPL